MQLILIFLALCSGSILTVLLTKRKAEEAVPFTITTIIFVLFLFYINNQLNIGYYFLLSIIGLVYLFSLSFILYTYIKNHDTKTIKNVTQRIFTPGMLIFLVLYIGLYIVTRKNIVCDWDSLRLWGAYPKALYYTNQLQLGSESLIYSIMQPYPPGVALFQYFVQRLSGSFQESGLFWAYGIIAVSIFLPAIRNANWKDPWWIFVSAFLIFVTPMFFSNSGFDDLYMYRSLFIDPILGLLFAYCVFIWFQEKTPDVYAFIRLGVGFGALTLMKDSGVTLAIIALLIILVASRTKLRESGRKEALQRLCLLSIGIVFIAGCYGLWHVTLRQHGVASIYQFAVKSLTFDLSFIKDFFRGFLTISVLNTPMFGATPGYTSFSIVFAEVVCFLFAFIITRLNREQDQKRTQRLLIGLVIGNILYFVGIFITYLGVYNKTMPSFARYSCTILQANIALIVSLLFHTGTDQIAVALKGKSILKLWVAFIAICSIAIFPLNIEPNSMDAAPESKIHANIIRNDIIQNDGIPDDRKKSVYLAFNQYDYDIRHHRIYFELLSENIFVELYSLNVPNQENLIFTANPTQENIAQMKQSFLNTLSASNCSYVYFIDDIPQTKEQMPEFFSQGSLEGDMYKIIYSDQGEIVSFQKIETKIDDLEPYTDR